MKTQFRKDIIHLTRLFHAFRAAELFAPTEEEIRAYRNYYDCLITLAAKYHTTPRQIASAINY